jgi:cell division protein FtsI (penicillin-binding protein 3)
MLLAYLVLTLLMSWRLVTIQVVSAAEYRSLAERQTQREIALPARRGRLYDRAGEPLALSLAAATVYANPRLLAAEEDVDLPATAATLADLIGRPAEAVLDALSRDASFVYLARQLPRETGEQVLAAELPGVGVLEEPRRTYPAGSLAAQVVGFAGVDNTGLSGLELQYDAVLAGQPGSLRLERAPGGLVISNAPREIDPPVAGTDLVLTLDRQIQYATEQALADALEHYNAKAGSAVVLDVANGEVLAMASAPGFAVEDTGAIDAFERRNRTLTDVFEPGSVSKVVTAAAALEEGRVGLNEVFEVPDHYEYAGRRFKDAYPHDTAHWTLREIMERSSNVGTIKLAERVGPELLHSYLQRFGYGQSTETGFPGESAGLVPPVDGWWATSLPTIAIGQGVSTTLLQLAGAYRAIAAGGEWTQPKLVRGTVDSDGRLRPSDPGTTRTVVSAGTARALANMLAGVVETGTGGLAAVPGYPVAGKTGTAQKPSATSRGYEEGAYIASFAGFAPVDDPALVVAVMIDEPTPIYGSLTAAPVFSEVMGFALRHRRIAPGDPDILAWEAQPAGR